MAFPLHSPHGCRNSIPLLTNTGEDIPSLTERAVCQQRLGLLLLHQSVYYYSEQLTGKTQEPGYTSYIISLGKIHPATQPSVKIDTE
ncbi:hypothetical protein ElyMa_005099000 [Elysia marginata]|uniref:Uncharacterized protein n=1 Tax=Elysia marginata TaxID=1093978 RepID=A0AAV4JH78_9GAST|nr:hypothetical protein ElyMa_005099000 [Elysia marginata]